MRRGWFGAAAVFAAVVVLSGSAEAKVLDAVYRGTLECGRPPFGDDKTHDTVRVTIFDGKIKYSRVVQISDNPDAMPETGSGRLDGQNIRLTGAWRGSGRAYNAVYVGTFIRRTARLTGTQTWMVDGKVVVRTCRGSIKRPFRMFIRHPKPDAA